MQLAQARARRAGITRAPHAAPRAGARTRAHRAHEHICHEEVGDRALTSIGTRTRTRGERRAREQRSGLRMCPG